MNLSLKQFWVWTCNVFEKFVFFTMFKVYWVCWCCGLLVIVLLIFLCACTCNALRINGWLQLLWCSYEPVLLQLECIVFFLCNGYMHNLRLENSWFSKMFFIVRLIFVFNVRLGHRFVVVHGLYKLQYIIIEFIKEQVSLRMS